MKSILMIKRLVGIFYLFLESVGYELIFIIEMELEIDISDVINVDEDGFICFSGRESMKQLRPHYK